MAKDFSGNRIFKNSILLYVRMLFTMWLNLYATRLVLRNLGVEDMGVYGVVGSIVGLVGVFTGGITDAVQRFITFEFGRDGGCPNKVFNSSLNVIFLLALVVLLVLEVGGNWMLYHHVKIPADSMQSAVWVFQLSVLTCVVNLISVPYNALIIAHEKMGAFALISVLQVFLSCAAAYGLTCFDANRLLIYGILMAIVSIAIRIIYQAYCRLKFPESKFRLYFDKQTIVEISKFTGISSASNGLQILYTQGIIFVINWIFGVGLNAVYSIATQLKNSVMSFGLNILKALAPQIIKTYASGDLELHKRLVYSGSKMEAFMVYFIMLPFLCKTEYIMTLWLGIVPEHTVIFVRCTIFTSLVYAIFEPIKVSVLSTNKIMRFMLIPDAFYLLGLPLSYAVGLYTKSPGWMIMATVIVDFLICLVRVYYAVQVSPIRYRELWMFVVWPCILSGLVGGICAFYLGRVFHNSLGELLLYLFLNSVALTGVIYCLGLSKAEKGVVRNMIKKMKR